MEITDKAYGKWISNLLLARNVDFAFRKNVWKIFP
jgi:hypothetical protein